MPEINEYISIMNAVKETELPRTTIVNLIDNDDLTVSGSIVTGRTMILKTSLNDWFASYQLSKKGLAEALTDGQEIVDGVSDYLVATAKQIRNVEFSDLSSGPRVLNDVTEFYQSVLDTATILVD